MSNLRKATIELAHEKPELRKELLPLLEKEGAARKKTLMKRVQGTPFQIDWVQEVYWSEQQWQEEEPDDYPNPIGEPVFTKTSITADPYTLWVLGESDRWNGILMNIEDGEYVSNPDNMTEQMYDRLLAKQEASVREISDRLTSAGSPTPEAGTSYLVGEFIRDYYKFQLYSAVESQLWLDLHEDDHTRLAKKNSRLWKAMDWDYMQSLGSHPVERKFHDIELMAGRAIDKAKRVFKWANMRQIDREIAKILKRTDKDLMSLVADEL